MPKKITINGSFLVDIIIAIYQVKRDEIAESIGRDYHYISRLRTKNEIEENLFKSILSRYPNIIPHLEIEGIETGSNNKLISPIKDPLTILAENQKEIINLVKTILKP